MRARFRPIPHMSDTHLKVIREDLEEAVTKKRNGNIFSKMGKPGQPIKEAEFNKFFDAVARVRGEKSVASLIGHLQKGVPAWRKKQGT